MKDQKSLLFFCMLLLALGIGVAVVWNQIQRIRPLVFLTLPSHVTTHSIAQIDPDVSNCSQPLFVEVDTGNKMATTLAYVRWQSDSQNLLYLLVSYEQGTESLWVMSLDGSKQKEIIPPQPRSLGLWTARMSPNQKYVAFQENTSDTDPNQWALYVYNVEKAAFRHLMDAVWFFRWSRDNRLAVENWSNGSIYILAPDGQVERVIKDIRLSNPELEWSPDSKKLALVVQQSDETPLNAEIAIIDLWTNQRKSVAQGNELYKWRTITSLAWSPDGKRIAFVSTYERTDGSGASGELFLVDLETGNETRLTGGAEPDSPQWSADGKRIAFLAQDQNSHQQQIYLADVTTGKLKQLTCFDGQKFSLSW